MFVCNPDNTTLAPIVRYSDASGKNSLKLTLNYNRTSELSVDVYKYIKDAFHREPVETDSICQCYQYITNYRQIHVEDLGYFIITKVEINDDGVDPYISVTATSCEIEINNKGFSLAAGTYQLWNPLSPTDSIIGKILSICPDWSVGSIPTSVASINRTFDDIAESAYAFMMNDMANAFSCICDFDIENRKINIISMDSEVQITSILLTYDNVINNIKLSQDAENIITALNVSGGSSILDTNLDLTSVNPIGGNVIYNFNYFMTTNWMPQTLIDSINAWETKIENNQATFANGAEQLQEAYTQLNTLDGQLSDLNAQLLSLKQAESVASQEDYDSAHAAVLAKETDIGNKQAEIDIQNAKINSIKSQLTAIQTDSSMTNNFTQDQLNLLSKFIFQQDFKDENIIITDSMTYVQRQVQAQALYDKAQLLLNQRSQPTYTCELTCQNFLLMPEFEIYRNQIELGKMIHVEVNPNDIANFALLQYVIEYDQKTLTIAVSNRLKLYDNIKDEQDWQTQLSTSSNTMSMNKSLWNYPTKSGTIQDLTDFASGSLNLTKNDLIATTGQKPILDSLGFHGFKQNTDGSYDPEQMWATNNKLCFTNDNWQTLKTALGKFKLPNGNYVYGLNAEAIVAGLIYANMIQLGGSGTNGTMTLYDQNNNPSIVFSNQGISLQNGAKLIGDSGLLNTFVYQTSGSYFGFEYLGWKNTGGSIEKVNAYLYIYIPQNISVTKATIYVDVISRYFINGGVSDVPTGYYVASNIKLYTHATLDSAIWYSPEASEPSLSIDVGTQNGDFGTWNPIASSTIQRKEVDVTSSIISGQRTMFTLTGGADNYVTNAEFIDNALVKITFVVVGYKGG